jgi:hypothetical protein
MSKPMKIDDWVTLSKCGVSHFTRDPNFGWGVIVAIHPGRYDLNMGDRYEVMWTKARNLESGFLYRRDLKYAK